MKEEPGTAEVAGKAKWGAKAGAKPTHQRGASATSTCSTQEPANITSKQTNHRTTMIHYEKSRYASPSYRRPRWWYMSNSNA